MANEKFLYVNGQGNYQEAPAAIQTSTGASDAGKLIQTAADGKIDSSLINFSAFNKVYPARAASTADVNISNPGTSTFDGVTLSSGDRLLLKDQTAGAENGIWIFNGSSSALTRATDWDEASEIKAGDIVVVEEGSSYAEKIFILATNNPIVVGTTALNFSAVGTQLISAGAGLSFTDTTLNVNAGDGIQIISDAVAVKASDLAGTGLEDDGSNNLRIDFANPATEMGTQRAVAAADLSSNGSNQGAKILGFDPATVSAYTSETTLQGALEDAFDLAAAPGIYFSVGTGGVTAGYPVYISGDDTVRTYGTLSNADRVIGVARTTVSSGGTVRVCRDSVVLPGALSGATAGTRYYWNGSALTTTMPSGSGSHVWVVGVAKNATDLLVDVAFLKKNA
jgi:hypothetical protein